MQKENTITYSQSQQNRRSHGWTFTGNIGKDRVEAVCSVCGCKRMRATKWFDTYRMPNTHKPDTKCPPCPGEKVTTNQPRTVA